MLKLKLQYFGYLMRRVDSLEKTLMLGGIGGRRRRGRQRMRWLVGITDSHGRESGWTPGVGDGQGGLACCNSWCHKESDMTERLVWSDLISWSSGAVADHTEAWPRGATPCPRSGAAAAKRSNPTSKERRLHGHRRAERSYSTFKVKRADSSKVGSNRCTLLEQL